MNNRFFFMISRLNNALKMHTQKAFKEAGINISNAQVGLLFALEKGHPLTMSNLSETIKTDNAATFRLVENLLKLGYVKREQNPDDLRQQLITITDSGKKIISIAFKIIKQSNQKMKNYFSEEEANTFNQVLAKLVAELEKNNFI
jgi:DNA-binding MarR family transcriptional regulator